MLIKGVDLFYDLREYLLGSKKIYFYVKCSFSHILTYIYIYMYRTRAFFSSQIVTQSKYKGQREIRSSTDCLLYIATVGVSLKSVAAVGHCTTGLKIITSLSSIALYCIVYFTIIDCIVLYCTVL